MARELATFGPRVMELSLRPESVFQLVATLQLAMRNPKFTGAARVTAEKFISGARAFFDGAPIVQRMIDMGNDPRFDHDGAGDGAGENPEEDP
jgi:hypothetical protein